MVRLADEILEAAVFYCMARCMVAHGYSLPSMSSDRLVACNHIHLPNSIQAGIVVKVSETQVDSSMPTQSSASQRSKAFVPQQGEPSSGENLVSIIVPAYNAALYIQQTLESIFSQTYRSYEIIVVDDGSTDDTPRIVQQFGDSIRYIRQPNRGLSAARNTGIRNAYAEIIALLDSDDIWEPQFLQRMIPYLKLHPEAAGVYCGFQYINSKGDVVGKPSLNVVPPESFHSTLIEDGNWLAPCSVIFHKSLAEAAGLFDESLRAVEDWDMWIRLSENKPFVGLQEALVKYRRHGNNMSQDPERMIQATAQLTEKQFGPAEGDSSSWSPSKKQAFSSHFQGAATRYFAAGLIPKSADYLQKLAMISVESACSLPVWRGLARAPIPIEYQFDSSPPYDWALIHARFAELFDELTHRALLSVISHELRGRMMGFGFLALADEAGRLGELRMSVGWLWRAVRTYSPVLFARPFWGIMVRAISVSVSRKLKFQEAGL